MPITAAYNFVPLPEHIVEPDWQGCVSHDLPLREGLCAEIDIELKACTPLLVAGPKASNGQPRTFYTHPDGVKAVPGSTVRGMVRSVLELASFSRISMVDDRLLAERDVNRPDYRSRMANVRTGWLRFDQGRWEIRDCASLRVGHDVLGRNLGVDIPAKFKAALGDGQRNSPQWKYTLFAEAAVPLQLFTASPGPGIWDVVSVSGRSSGASVEPVTLVLTGQVNTQKRREFLFFAPDNGAPPIEIDALGWAQFRSMHDLPGSPYRHLVDMAGLGRFGGHGVPVFYLPAGKGKKVSHLGICRMFKLPYPQRLRGFMGPLHDGAKPVERMDFVQTLFGTHEPPVAQGAADPGALKSRVFFGDLRCKDAGSTVPAAFSEATVLASPKPGYWPTYFRQKPLFDTGARQPELSGAKRYPAHTPADVTRIPRPPAGVGDAVTTRMDPAGTGATFTGRIRLHNVMPQELGAVLWVLLWGGDDQLRHAMGMGRPFGMGQVKVALTSMAVRANDPARADEMTSKRAGDWMATFTHWMQECLKAMQPGADWTASDTIKELLAMAKPGLVPDHLLRSMVLDVNGRNNPFRDMKRGPRPTHLPRHSENALSALNAGR